MIAEASGQPLRIGISKAWYAAASVKIPENVSWGGQGVRSLDSVGGQGVRSLDSGIELFSRPARGLGPRFGFVSGTKVLRVDIEGAWSPGRRAGLSNGELGSKPVQDASGEE